MLRFKNMNEEKFLSRNIKENINWLPTKYKRLDISSLQSLSRWLLWINKDVNKLLKLKITKKDSVEWSDKNGKLKGELIKNEKNE